MSPGGERIPLAKGLWGATPKQVLTADRAGEQTFAQSHRLVERNFHDSRLNLD